MKRKLNEARKNLEILKDWLTWPNYYKISTCPFNAFSSSKNVTICKEIFPSLQKLNLGIKITKYRHCHYKCPCTQFTQSYIHKVVRKIIKEIEEE